jgi:hypothetical protein
MEITERNFILRRRYLGKGYTIKVNSQNFQYNHDELFKSQKERFFEGGRAYSSWNNYGYYTQSSGYPNWASNHVSKIKQ